MNDHRRGLLIDFVAAVFSKMFAERGIPVTTSWEYSHETCQYQITIKPAARGCGSGTDLATLIPPEQRTLNILRMDLDNWDGFASRTLTINNREFRFINDKQQPNGIEHPRLPGMLRLH